MNVLRAYKFKNENIVPAEHCFYCCITDEGPCFLYQKGNPKIKGPSIMFPPDQKAVCDFMNQFHTPEDQIETIASIVEFAFKTPFLLDDNDVLKQESKKYKSLLKSDLSPTQVKADVMTKLINTAICYFKESNSTYSSKVEHSLSTLEKFSEAFKLQALFPEDTLFPKLGENESLDILSNILVKFDDKSSDVSIDKYSNLENQSEFQLFKTETNLGIFQFLIFPKDNLSLFFADPEGVIKELKNKYTRLNADERISVIKKVVDFARSTPIFLSELNEDYVPKVMLNIIQKKSWFCLKLIDLAIQDFKNAKNTHMSVEEVKNLFKENEQFFFRKYSSPNYVWILAGTREGGSWGLGRSEKTKS